LLRPPVITDFEAYRNILMSDRAVHMDGPFDRRGAWLDFTQCVANWLLRGHGLWTVTAKATGRTLGFVLVCLEFGDREPELGWFFLAEAEGQGFAMEAAAAARRHALGDLGLGSLVSYVATSNHRSLRLAARLGAWHDAAATAEIDDPATQVWRHWPPEGDDGGIEAYA
jgi:RimJ/RimL family protein N-acetyltransferase